MIETAALVPLIFLSILRWIVIFDVILSWSALFGFRIRIPFVRSLLDPLYRFIRAHFPVSFSGLDFAPIVLLLGIFVAEWGIIRLVPSVTVAF